MKSSPAHTSPLQQHYAAAQRFQSAHEMDKAAYEYKVFLTDALGETAIRRAQAGQYEKAAADFDEALTFAPHSVVLQLEYAQAALQSGDLAHAKLLAERVNGESPQNAQAHLILGQVLLRKNMNQEARRELERAVALDSTFENGYELAVACLNTGDQQYAAKLFQEMTSSFGNTALIHLIFWPGLSEFRFSKQGSPRVSEGDCEGQQVAGRALFAGGSISCGCGRQQVV